MDTTKLSAPVAQFVHNVATAFDLAETISVAEMAGSANRLWRFTTTKGIFVVKELPYNNSEEGFALRQAANFEAMLIGQQRVAGPAPVPNRRGEYVVLLTDSRGQESPVRLHPWFRGVPPQVDDPAILLQAGRTLRAIQLAGAAWSVQPKGSLQLWTDDPSSVLDHFWASGHLDGTTRGVLHSTVTEALALVRAGESMPGAWVYTHRDHKPENCLSQDGVLAVLDWDECNYCHPRLEAIEAALRWAGSDDPSPEHFSTFMTGYNESGVPLDMLEAQDFAKWLADLLSWFCFQARRTAGEWPEVTEAERGCAAQLARAALTTLQSSLAALPRWIRFL
jgi:Ser/Thr protein kinase RdoA (MazF antagonist)